MPRRVTGRLAMTRWLACILCLAIGSAAWADSWSLPKKTSYRSADKSARLTVRPRDLKSQLAYFQDKVDGREPAGAAAGSRSASATATLERRSASGGWRKVWTGPLDNEVAPVEVVVANGGRAFATFDNWHSMGHGPNVLVIYDGQGKLVRRFALADLLPDWFIAVLPASISSMRWRGEPRMSDDGHLIVPVLQPSLDHRDYDAERRIDLAIRLSDGAPVGLERPEWKAALAAAAEVAREKCRIAAGGTIFWPHPVCPVTADGKGTPPSSEKRLVPPERTE